MPGPVSGRDALKSPQVNAIVPEALIRIGKKKVPFIKNGNKNINEHADIHEHEIFQPTLFTFSAVKFPGLYQNQKRCWNHKADIKPACS